MKLRMMRKKWLSFILIISMICSATFAYRITAHADVLDGEPSAEQEGQTEPSGDGEEQGDGNTQEEDEPPSDPPVDPTNNEPEGGEGTDSEVLDDTNIEDDETDSTIIPPDNEITIEPEAPAEAESEEPKNEQEEENPELPPSKNAVSDDEASKEETVSGDAASENVVSENAVSVNSISEDKIPKDEEPWEEFNEETAQKKVERMLSVYGEITSSDNDALRVLEGRIEYAALDYNDTGLHTEDERSLDFDYVDEDYDWRGAYAGWAAICRYYFERANGHDGTDVVDYIRSHSLEDIIAECYNSHALEDFENDEVGYIDQLMTTGIYILPFISKYGDEVTIDWDSRVEGDDCKSGDINRWEVCYEIPVLLDGEDVGIKALYDEKGRLLTLDINHFDLPERARHLESMPKSIEVEEDVRCTPLFMICLLCE